MVADRLARLVEEYDALFDAWEQAGHELYLVGGCVRDVVMGLDSIGDVDLATDATPDETSEILAKHGWKVIPIGARFGTIATLHHGEQLEITTYRVDEEYERSSRKPSVVFGKELTHDLSRRDLSINAMAAGRGGHVEDPFDGHTAIEQGILEVPGGGLEHTESILRDDPLRLLRIARFAARFGFAATNETTAAARKTARELENISRERWKMEMDKLLVSDFVPHGLRWLSGVGALEVIFPDSRALLEASSPQAGVEELGRVLAMVPPVACVRWAILRIWLSVVRETSERPDYSTPLSPVPTKQLIQDAEETARTFRFSNQERKALKFLCGRDERLSDIQPPWDRLHLRRWLYEHGELSLPMVDVICALSVHESAASYRKIAREKLEEARKSEDIEPRLPHGFGREVIAAFSLPRGPEIAQAIDFAKDAIIDGKLENGADSERYLAYLSRHEGQWRGVSDGA